MLSSYFHVSASIVDTGGTVFFVFWGIHLLISSTRLRISHVRIYRSSCPSYFLLFRNRLDKCFLHFCETACTGHRCEKLTTYVVGDFSLFINCCASSITSALFTTSDFIKLRLFLEIQISFLCHHLPDLTD